jgi:hypothetical protein
MILQGSPALELEAVPLSSGPSVAVSLAMAPLGQTCCSSRGLKLNGRVRHGREQKPRLRTYARTEENKKEGRKTNRAPRRRPRPEQGNNRNLNLADDDDDGTRSGVA